MPERVLTLYGRRACPLCDEMRAALQPWVEAGQVRLEWIDIDRAPDLKARFDWDVPLLFCGEFEICRHTFDPAAFDVWLKRR